MPFGTPNELSAKEKQSRYDRAQLWNSSRFQALQIVQSKAIKDSTNLTSLSSLIRRIRYCTKRKWVEDGLDKNTYLPKERNSIAFAKSINYSFFSCSAPDKFIVSYFTNLSVVLRIDFLGFILDLCYLFTSMCLGVYYDCGGLFMLVSS